MSVYADSKLIYEEVELGEECIVTKNGEPPTATMEQEKRIRREIANSNERRRMQSINNGFKSLRLLLPHHEGEKLSKAAILQQTAEYIYALEQEKTVLLSQNCQLKRIVHQHEGGELPPKKRKTADPLLITGFADSSDEGGINSLTAAGVAETETITELRRALERERTARIAAEEQNRQFESQLYQQQIYHVEEAEEIGLQIITADAVPAVGHTQTVVCSPINSRSSSPTPESPVEEVVLQQQQVQERLPSVLEAAIKAEPKVEVERLPSPTGGCTPPHSDESATRIYVSNTSRQNLETIVEAIRHLEGDHMFGDEPQQQHAQELPLALTTTARTTTTTGAAAGGVTVVEPVTLTSGETVRVELVHPSIVEFHHTPASIQHQQQSRPGVIVGKQQAALS